MQSMANKFDRKEFGTIKYKFLLDAPFKISNKCCDVMKKKPAKKYAKKENRNPFIGTMATESRLRKTKWIKSGCNAFNEKHPTSQPLSFWTEQDILHYIKQNKLEIASAYGNIVYTDDDGMQYDNDVFNSGMKLTTTGESRTGCVFCMFGITHDTERFVRLKEREPKKYDYVMRGGKFDENGMWIPNGGLGYKFVIDWLNEHGGFNIKY
jgi:3'-phosphoadenosine 5'-phosphosulfate sulfotransferase (PAPS reductase)/FAD synthetase